MAHCTLLVGLDLVPDHLQVAAQARQVAHGGGADLLFDRAHQHADNVDGRLPFLEDVEQHLADGAIADQRNFELPLDSMPETGEDASAVLEDTCRDYGCPCLSVLDPVLSLFQSYLGAETIHRAGAQHVLNAEYFQRIDALNFSMMHDDGQHVEGNPKKKDYFIDAKQYLVKGQTMSLQLIVLDESEKKETHGYDVIIVAWYKSQIMRDARAEIIKKLKKYNP